MHSIGNGAGELMEAEALETAPIIGKALKPYRDKVYIASKFCTAKGHLDSDTPVPEIIAAVESSLQRLQTDALLAHRAVDDHA